MGIIIKTEEQIDGIRRSSKLAAATLNYIEPFIKAGVNTEHLDNLIHKFITDRGAIPAPLNYHGFPKSSCISLNDVICHGIPSADTVLKDGDILNVDITTILDGYYGDTSRMFEIGEISEEAALLIDTAEHSLNLAIEQVRPGNRLGNIGHVITKYAQKSKFSVVYEFCGHGVGIEFHEDPQIDHTSRKNSGPKLQAGMIFTIEPMINAGRAKAVIDKVDGWTARTIDGKLSAQFEHTILVTETGYEILTIE